MLRIRERRFSEYRFSERRGADFRGADFRGADFRGAEMQRCRFHRCRMQILDFRKHSQILSVPFSVEFDIMNPEKATLIHSLFE